jgi:hypothetical protein
VEFVLGALVLLIVVGMWLVGSRTQREGRERGAGRAHAANQVDGQSGGPRRLGRGLSVFDADGATYAMRRADGSYHLNVATPRSWAGTVSTVTVEFTDGQRFSATFAFR